MFLPGDMAVALDSTQGFALKIVSIYEVGKFEEVGAFVTPLGDPNESILAVQEFDFLTVSHYTNTNLKGKNNG